MLLLVLLFFFSWETSFPLVLKGKKPKTPRAGVELPLTWHLTEALPETILHAQTVQRGKVETFKQKRQEQRYCCVFSLLLCFFWGGNRWYFLLGSVGFEGKGEGNPKPGLGLPLTNMAPDRGTPKKSCARLVGGTVITNSLPLQSLVF